MAFAKSNMMVWAAPSIPPRTLKIYNFFIRLKGFEPLEFIVGSGQVIPGFDKAVIGMKLMGEKRFTLQPAEAYGERKQKLTHKVLRSGLPPKPEPKSGMGLMMGGGPGGASRRAMITEVTKEYIVIDMNHPLAGKALTFAIKLIKISN